jgi:hypothetical protein
MNTTSTGSCLCESVSFEISGAMSDVIFCHCKQCRKHTGHYAAATSVNTEQLMFHQSNHLKWFASSKQAERGFCNNCGSNLFWREKKSSVIYIWAGAISEPNTLKPASHIYTKYAGNYYTIPDDGEHFNYDFLEKDS